MCGSLRNKGWLDPLHMALIYTDVRMVGNDQPFHYVIYLRCPYILPTD